MKILFIGGNGNISWWCVQRAIEKGYDVWEVNRAMTRKTRRPVQKEVHQIICDVRDADTMRAVLNKQSFDVVCDFISYDGKQAEQMVDLFLDKTNQYIVISSEAVYKRQPDAMPFSEESEKYCLDEVSDCSYIKGKIEMEGVYMSAYRDMNFPVTIVRPAYTYDLIIHTSAGGNCFTAIKKMQDGYPMIVYGDGNNVLVPMHSKDFSRYFIELCGNKTTIGESYHIVGQEQISLNKMAECVMEAFHVEKNGIIHIPPKDVLANEIFSFNELIRQQMLDYVFDSHKINIIVNNQKINISYKDGIQETANLLMNNCNYRRIDETVNERLDKIYKMYDR